MSSCVVHHHHHHPAPSAAALTPTPEAPATPPEAPAQPADVASPWRGGAAAQEPWSAAPHQTPHQTPHQAPQPDLAPAPAPPLDTTSAPAPAPGRASKAATPTPTRKLYVVRAAPGGAVMIASPDLSAQELDSFRQMGAHVEESDIPHGVDVVDLDRAEPSFKEIALREAIAWKSA